jgi:hypothetical protein
MRAGLGVDLLAERQRPLDQQGLRPHVVPARRQRFAGPQACIREDGEQRRVARRRGVPHPFDRLGRERPYLLAPRSTRAPDEPDRIAADALSLDGALEDGSQEVERLANGDRARPGGEPVGLPARDPLGPQLTSATPPRSGEMWWS